MCVSGIPHWLISPIGLIKEAGKAMGVDSKLLAPGAEWTDPASIIANKMYEKEKKQTERQDKDNREAWARYYASQNAQTTSAFKPTNRG